MIAGKNEDTVLKGSYASARHIEFMIYLERADSQGYNGVWMDVM